MASSRTNNGNSSGGGDTSVFVALWMRNVCRLRGIQLRQTEANDCIHYCRILQVPVLYQFSRNLWLSFTLLGFPNNFSFFWSKARRSEWLDCGGCRQQNRQLPSKVAIIYCPFWCHSCCKYRQTWLIPIKVITQWNIPTSKAKRRASSGYWQTVSRPDYIIIGAYHTCVHSALSLWPLIQSNPPMPTICA